MSAPTTTDNPYLDVWTERLNHQRRCCPRRLVDFAGVEQPDAYCFGINTSDGELLVRWPGGDTEKVEFE